MVTEEVDVIAHFDADTERSQMGSIFRQSLVKVTRNHI